MSLLQFNNFASPTTFKWTDPDTKHQYTGANLKDLCQKIRSYRSQNELSELDYLETIVEDYLCRLPQHNGSCRHRGPLKRGIVKTLRGGVAVLQNMLFKSFASQEEADRRSAICKDCAFNDFPDRDRFVKWSDSIAQMSIQDRRSKHHDDLGTCLGCLCPMRSKVFWNGPVDLKEEDKIKMKAVNPQCWQVVK